MRRFGLIAGAFAIGGVGLAAWYWLGEPAAAPVPVPAPAAIPVQAATASKADVPIYETGLGNVQAFNTVTVKVRVDGELQKVDFTEGQMVKAGDLLAQVDPRPFLSQMTSTSALGNTVISLQFDLNRNIDAAAGDVQAAINAAAGQLPKTLPTPPTYRKVNPADSPILVLAVHSDTLPLTKIDAAAETIIAQQISQISGVAYVAIGGQQKPAVRIQVDPAKLASLGLSLEDLRSVILNATTDAPKGNLDGPTRNLAVYDNDQIMNAAPWNDVIIAYRNGAPVR